MSTHSEIQVMPMVSKSTNNRNQAKFIPALVFVPKKLGTKATASINSPVTGVMREVTLLWFKDFIASLSALITIALVFYFAALGGLGYVSLIMGAFVFIHSVYLSYSRFRQGKYIVGGIATFIALLVVIRVVLPVSHEGFGYDENGDKSSQKHEHYIWEFDHIH